MDTHVALVSGGMDSAVAAHVSVRWGDADLLVYLDTRTGLDENREYVEELADRLGVQLWTLRTHESYEERVEEHGFPGPSRHSIMYRSLKERQIQRLAARCSGELHCWTGVRSQESERRMRNVSPDQEAAGGRWYWHAPIHDWSKQECREYVDSFDLPKNPLWSALGRSGDCFCGCFASPEEKIDLRAAGCDYHADWLNELEDRTDADDETGRWAWGALSPSERRAERVDENQMTLCSTCDVTLPDGGDTGTAEGTEER
jgi:3'-phosphoadenosine 5'-phosphosulfate sulfotransferase (PAPS reductase)/FAD synthetase